jgi:hypothetical protein
MIKTLVRAASVAAVLSLGVTANASAATIDLTSGANVFQIVWDHDTQPLDAIANFTANVSSGSIVFTVTVTNNSADVGSGLQSFGFNINPDPTGIQNFTGTVFTAAGLEQNLPSIDNSIDVCVWAANNCQGGPQQSNLNGGGAVGTASFTLLGNFASGATLDLFGAKFQTAFGSFEFEGNPPPPTTQVPEPTSMVLVGLGMASVLGLKRRA